MRRIRTLIRTPADLGALIRDRRRQRGFDQQTLADEVGVVVNGLSPWRRVRRELKSAWFYGHLVHSVSRSPLPTVLLAKERVALQS
jgi:hypothetical protein